MKLILSFLFGVTLVMLSACEERATHEPGQEPRETERHDHATSEHMKTFETEGLRQAVDQYKENPTAENRLEVEKAFGELDKEIMELETQVQEKTGDEQAEAQRKLDDLRSFKNEQQVRFTGERAQSALEKTGETLEKAAEETGDFLQRTGEQIKDAVTDEPR